MLQNYDRIGFAIFIMAFIAASCANSAGGAKARPSSRNNVEIRLTHIAPYCGGARPTHGLLEKSVEIQPLGNKLFFIVEGEENNPGQSRIMCSATTDDSGHARVRLPRGKYGLVFSDKADRKFFDDMMRLYSLKSENYSEVDSACLKNWLKEFEITIEIQRDTEYSFELLVHDKCPWNQLPCIEYTGPLPP